MASPTNEDDIKSTHSEVDVEDPPVHSAPANGENVQNPPVPPVAEASVNSAAVKGGTVPTGTPPIQPPADVNGVLKEKDLEAAAVDVQTILSNRKANEEANDRLLMARGLIDSVIIKPTFWKQMVTHKVLIATIILTLLGMVGSILGLVTGYVAEKDRGALVLTGAILSLVGNFVSSATGVFVTPPTLGKKTT